MIRVAVGIVVYFVVLGLVAVVAYALWAGPQLLGVTQPWPLAFYFVVPLDDRLGKVLAVVLVAAGIITAVRAGPGLMRRVE